MVPLSDLHMSVAHGYVEDVQNFLTQENVDSEGAWDWRGQLDRTPVTTTPLFCACCWGRVDILPLLIEAGADVNKPHHDGRTPLHQACNYDGPEAKASAMVEILVSSGANVNMVDHGGLTPFALLCQRMPQIRKNKIFQLLIDAGADVNQMTSICYSSPKTLPNKKYHMNCFPPDEKQHFLSLWNNPKDPIPEPSTPLICACYFGRFDLLQLFIAAGADVNLPNSAGWTPLHEACDHRGPNVNNTVEFLLNNGATINICDHRGVTPLHTACVSQSRRRHTVVRMLMKAGAVGNFPAPSCRYLANPTANRNNKYCSQGLLHFAIGNNQTLVKMLIDSGVDINARCWRGRTPLFFAVQSRDTCSLRMLVKAGADLNIANYVGLTALHEAIHMMSYENALLRNFESSSLINTRNLLKMGKCVEFLLECGANLNQVDAEGRTPLEIANDWTHSDVVGRLLDHGAGINVKCKKHLCPCLGSYTVTVCQFIRNEPIHEIVYRTHYYIMAALGLPLGEEFLHFDMVKSWEPELAFSKALLEVETNQVAEAMNKTIGNSGITFYDVLMQRPSAIKNPLINEILTKDYCRRECTAYSSLVYARFVRGKKRFALMEQCIPFFSLLEPLILEECAIEVLSYLGEQDLLNIMEIIM